jgi:prepilin-type N-terminal cleavage/methylation domain-containing protein
VSTERHPLERRDGFTLIEVLVAMVILAVGLLGLEALGIHAFRSVALAERNSQAATIATMYVEQAIGELRSASATVPAPVSTTVDGYTVVREAPCTPAGGPAAQVRVRVTVTPPARGPAANPLSLRSDIFNPNLATGVSACSP